MRYEYDAEGFYVGECEDSPRSTPIAPLGNENNFAGDRWVYVDRAALEAQKAQLAAEAAEQARKQGILDQIAATEATITNRRIREAALTQAGKDWMAAQDAAIAALRAQL
jgi:hypothetical protein